MTHSKENGVKSKNGVSAEKKFSKLTGLKKTTEKQKPFFINSYGEKQTIDFDFSTVINGVTFFFDITNTYRSDRAKQKGYNSLLSKLYFDLESKFYIVINDSEGKKIKRKKIEGIDGIINMEDTLKLFVWYIYSYANCSNRITI